MGLKAGNGGDPDNSGFWSMLKSLGRLIGGIPMVTDIVSLGDGAKRFCKKTQGDAWANKDKVLALLIR